mgnify:CR=1 FL=1
MSQVYSYLRFSSAKQAAGSSAARQADYARRWAAEHGMVLDESLSMRDEGLSAFHQKHIKSGALGVFLDAVTTGRIPSGSTLIVEGLDRLSRAEPILAQAQLAQIINAGINVVTASDGKQYNRESLKANPMDLVYSLLVMIRAHEESDTKSKRVKQAIHRACKAWEAGEKVIVGGICPSWVRRTHSGRTYGYELIPEVAAGLREAIRMYCEGYGPHRILADLKERGIGLTGDNCAGNVDHLLKKQPELFRGNRPVSVLGENFLLKGYYPALISEEEFARLSVEINARSQRTRRSGGKAVFPTLLSGGKIGTCGHCGGNLVSQNSVRNERSVYRRLRCPTCELAATKAGVKSKDSSCTITPLENAVLTYCSDQFNLAALTAGGGADDSLKNELLAIRAQRLELERKITKIIDASLEDDSELPAAYMRKVRDMEEEIQRLNYKYANIESELAVAGASTPADAEAWTKLKQAALDLDYDARIKMRRLFDDTFAGIRVYFRGALPTSPAGAIDVLLEGKSGARRLLSVDKKAGRVLRAIEYRPEQR